MYRVLNLVHFIPNPLRLSSFENHLRSLNGKPRVVSDKISVFTLLIAIS